MEYAPRLVVGVDGSPWSLWATRLAADEARARRAELRLVHVIDHSDDALRQDPFGILSAARAIADKTAPDLRIDIQAISSPSVAEPLVRGTDPRLIVIGARGWGGCNGQALGTVAQSAVALCETTELPVLVARGDEHPDGDVVVAIAGQAADSTLPTLIAAFEEARWRRARLVALRAFTRAGDHPFVSATTTASSLERQETLMVGDLLGRCRTRYPDVAVHVQVREEAPADAVIRISRTAQLVVVGGGSADGGLAAAARLRSACPVLTVPQHW
jgi:nucleotide-binding universal stress UspA family protein